MKPHGDCLVVRPFELLRIICRMGQGYRPPDLGDPRLNQIASAVAAAPRAPVEFGTYQGDRYNGRDSDAPDGALFSLLADHEIFFQITDGKSEAAFQPFSRIFGSAAGTLLNVCNKVKNVNEVCPSAAQGFTGAWTGPAEVTQANFVAGRAALRDWVRSLVPTANVWKTDEELANIRITSVDALNQSRVIRIFPSHLLYIMANFGGNADRLQGHPYRADNMYEVGLAMRRNPDTPLMFVPERCMLCPTCGSDDPDGAGICGILPMENLKPSRNIMSGRLQLRLLRTLGMEYYQPEPTVDVIRRTFEKVKTNHTSFTYKGAPPNAWAYGRCRDAGMGILDAYDNPQGVVDRVGKLLAHPHVQQLLPADDRDHLEQVLSRANRALNRNDHKEAYQTLTDEPFVYLWKFYLEKIAAGFARLPDSIQIERTEPDGFPCVEAIRSEKPVIASELPGSSAWLASPWAGGFRTIGDRPAIAETAFKAFHDDRALTVACMGAERNPAAIKADRRIGIDARIGDDVWNTVVGAEHWSRVDDSFVLCIQPDELKEPFFMFSVNARGVRIGERRRFESSPLPRSEWLYETDWHASTKVDPDGWTVLFSIPFSTLGVSGPTPTAWRLTVHRFIRNEELDPHSWAYPGLGITRQYYDHSHFGRLRFGGRA